ncbi:MAG: Proton/sodium-glutamate symport protein [Chlamydiales bacterium]|nr:Proton/sodium-glutamate symport protein [Chlamydiales bacterium]MCH9619240.1 Proton/sodium-glutamate symport protein [Chlamydiales bacterium]MCH9622502.1 Proton/sodium-glutamate symport protein [Chlamydiales bacterium]
MKLWKKMLLGLVLGTLSGIFLKERAEYLKPFGTVFLSLLNMVVVLLVFSSMTAGVTSINDVRKLGRVGLKTLLMYLGTTAIAILLGLIAAKLFNPGRGIGLAHDNVAINIDETPELLNMFLALVPSNPVGALANGHILQVIVFSIFLGLGINFAGEKGKPLAKLLDSLSEVMFMITGMVMSLAPYGIFAIMAWVAGTFGVAILVPLLKLLLAHYLTCIVLLVVVYGGILMFLAKVRVGPFVKGMTDAITLAASTTSSSATLPATLHCVEENLGVSKGIASFILPLGSTVNMNGTAIFQGIAAVFISQAYGIELGWENLLVIVVTATMSAIGCAGIPGGGIVTLSIVLGSVGLPLEGIAIVAGIDRVRDIIGTVVNVLGDGIVSVYVAKSEGELDEEQYNSGEYINYEHGVVAKESQA